MVTGDNAAGKSFVRRMYVTACGVRKVECINISLERRTSHDISTVFIFRDEQVFASGVISAETITAGFSTARNRSGKVMLVWDEPELGMSEELQLTAMNYVVDQVRDWPDNLEGLVFMTHSRIVVRELVSRCGAQFVNLGGKYPDAESWLAREAVALPSLECVSDEHIERFRRIAKMLEKRKR